MTARKASTLLIATRNPHKLEEYTAMFAGLGYDLRSLEDVGIDEDVDETGASFEENARLKAERYRDLSGLLTLADDSGLEVDALGGEPGVRSRRWAGEGLSDAERNSALLARLEDVPEAGRSARFRCAIAIAFPGGELDNVQGTCPGFILRKPAGEHGFGYDPIFLLPELGCSMAELTPEMKNQASHRARAAKEAVAILARL